MRNREDNRLVRGRGKREERRGKREEGRGKREEGRGKREGGSSNHLHIFRIS